MSARLREYALRGRIMATQAQAGMAWHGDWLTAGKCLAHAPMAPRVAAGEHGGDLMRQAARERLRRAEQALGGRQAPWYRLAHHVVLLDKSPAQVAPELDIDPRGVIFVLRLALDVLAGVYRLREHA
jgi:hypothetical protein